MIFVAVVLIVRLRLYVSGRKNTEEAKGHSHHTISICFTTVINHGHTAEVEFVRLPHCKVTHFPPFPYWADGRESEAHRRLKDEVLCSHVTNGVFT